MVWGKTYKLSEKRHALNTFIFVILLAAFSMFSVTFYCSTESIKWTCSRLKCQHMTPDTNNSYIMMIDFSFQVICWRAVASIAWAALLLPPTTAAFVILSRFSIFHPVQWISGQIHILHFQLFFWCEQDFRLKPYFFLLTECLSFLMSISIIFSLILMCCVIITVGFLNLEYYTGECRGTVFTLNC